MSKILKKEVVVDLLNVPASDYIAAGPAKQAILNSHCAQEAEIKFLEAAKEGYRKAVNYHIEKSGRQLAKIERLKDVISEKNERIQYLKNQLS